MFRSGMVLRRSVNAGYLVRLGVTSAKGDKPNGLSKFIPALARENLWALVIDLFLLLNYFSSLFLNSFISVASKSLFTITSNKGCRLYVSTIMSSTRSKPGIELFLAIERGAFSTSRSASGTTLPM